ncbi:hypothetical protein EMPS_11641 [Entomortierella parvispora]|uniref:Uncharacterized protein n=1 Tax=Entomortierella parvispora TaxID=205924 RepID=A0A9P3HMS4_9FUNG|nr:hypothetical protein EMPS_11641 [Entomortierella parvispora]
MTYVCKDEKQRAKMIIEDSVRKRHPAYKICLDLAWGRIPSGRQYRIDGTIINTTYYIKKTGGTDNYGLSTRVTVDRIEELSDGDDDPHEDDFKRLPKASYGDHGAIVSKIASSGQNDSSSEEVEQGDDSDGHQRGKAEEGKRKKKEKKERGRPRKKTSKRVEKEYANRAGTSSEHAKEALQDKDGTSTDNSDKSDSD